MSGDFQRRALALYRAGHRVVPIPKGTKGAIEKGWSSWADTQDEPQVQQLVAKANGCGVGILAKRTPGVDIDVRHAELAQQIAGVAHKYLGWTVERIGEPPKLLLPYRTEQPFSKIAIAFTLPGDKPGDKLHKIELLADGQQWVAYHIHPDTGRPYHWPEGELPPREALPEIDEEMARGFIEQCKPLILEYGGFIRAESDPEGNDGPAQPNPEQRGSLQEVKEALRHIPNGNLDYDSWVRIGLAIKAAVGDEGWPLFAGWSAQYEKDDPIETAKKWRSFKPGRIGAGTIYHIAQQHGWVRGQQDAANSTLFSQSCAPENASQPTENRLNSHNSLISQPSTSEWPRPLNKDAYYGLAGEVVRAIAPHTEADPAAILFQFLAGFGNQVGRGPYFQVEGDQHATNIFVGLVGESAKARKGTSWGRIRQLFEKADPLWAKERVVSGLASGEGLIWQVRDPITKQSKNKKTGEIEEFVEDEGVYDKRLLVQESELARVLRVMARDGNTLSAIIRDAWDRGNLRSLTKNSPAQATGALVTLVCHITADELRQELTRTDAANGFANRFLFACVRRSKCLPDGGANVDLSALSVKVGRALTTASQIGEVCRDAKAKALWHSVYPKLSEGRPGLWGAVTGRAEAQVLRLSLLYALLDGLAVIQEPHLKAALELWRFSDESAKFVFGESQGDHIADTILCSLKSTPAGLTRTEISDLFGRHADAARISVSVNALQSRGLIATETVTTKGRPKQVLRAVTLGLGCEKSDKSEESPLSMGYGQSGPVQDCEKRVEPSATAPDEPEYDGCSDEPEGEPESLDQPALRYPASLGASMIRHLERQERDTVQVNKLATVFWDSPLVGLTGGVKANKCKLVSLYDGPDSAYDDDSRGVQLRTEDRDSRGRTVHYQMGGKWPFWAVAVEGHAAPDDFPTEPHAFNEWFDGWTKRTGAKIICDYREEAEVAGAFNYKKPRESAPEWNDL